MIGFLDGTVQFVDLEREALTLNVNGVGYELHCSMPVLTGLASSIGSQVQFLIHTHVREDLIQLFAFQQRVEKELFLALVKINGIGPKLAMGILSATTVEVLGEMIESENVIGLSKLPKVGKKKAEQMILSLKGSLVLARDNERIAKLGSRGEVSSALIHLGYRSQEVDRVVAQFPPDIDVEEGVRKALATLSGQTQQL